MAAIMPCAPSVQRRSPGRTGLRLPFFDPANGRCIIHPVSMTSREALAIAWRLPGSIVCRRASGHSEPAVPGGHRWEAMTFRRGRVHSPRPTAALQRTA
uniref:Uncharacterized protein n=1 Tax=Ralstonia solanacearum CFBP2957 TaxID=859656 RepID=D8P5S2_RALSL|nr:protein of unknown function [Ralstonia solanacearum CFBP2957]